jgi:hypothetical protein
MDVFNIHGSCFMFSLLMLYRDDYIHGGLNINRFELLVASNVPFLQSTYCCVL